MFGQVHRCSWDLAVMAAAAGRILELNSARLGISTVEQHLKQKSGNSSLSSGEDCLSLLGEFPENSAMKRMWAGLV